MKYGCFQTSSGDGFCGVVVEDQVVPHARLVADQDAPDAMRFMLRSSPEDRIRLEGRAQREAEGGQAHPLEALTILPPYIHGARILCQVVNYLDHGSEVAIQPPELPFFFYKPPSSVVPTNAPIIAHAASRKLDFEVELAAVIGKPGSNIDAGDAAAHVAGYMIMNDISYRDLQFNERAPGLNNRFGRNWTKGKGLDNSCILGPWVTGVEDVPDPYELDLQCVVNGETRQSSSTSAMLFKLPELIAEASLGTTLNTGDIISTGSPAGVGLSDGRFLLEGDEVLCRISGLGWISNHVEVSV